MKVVVGVAFARVLPLVRHLKQLGECATIDRLRPSILEYSLRKIMRTDLSTYVWLDLSMRAPKRSLLITLFFIMGFPVIPAFLMLETVAVEKGPDGKLADGNYLDIHFHNVP